MAFTQYKCSGGWLQKKFSDRMNTILLFDTDITPGQSVQQKDDTPGIVFSYPAYDLSIVDEHAFSVSVYSA